MAKEKERKPIKYDFKKIVLKDIEGKREKLYSGFLYYSFYLIELRRSQHDSFTFVDNSC